LLVCFLMVECARSILPGFSSVLRLNHYIYVMSRCNFLRFARLTLDCLLD
jgi:hypothetical protein